MKRIILVALAAAAILYGLGFLHPTNGSPAPALQTVSAQGPDIAMRANIAKLECAKPGALEAGQVLINRVFTLLECETFLLTGTLPGAAAPAPAAGTTPAAVVNTGNVPACADKCFVREDARRTLVWSGLKDGTTSIVTGGEFLPLVRSGWAVEFEVTVKGYLEWCQGVVTNMTTGAQVTSKAFCAAKTHDADIFHLEPGKYRVTDSLGEDDGGFSWHPEVGVGWKAVISQDLEKCRTIDSSARTVTWTCPTDGSVTVTTADEMAIAAMRMGYTFIVNADRPGWLDFCVGGVRVDGVVVGEKKNCDANDPPFKVGKGKVTLSTDGYPNAYNIGGVTWRKQ